VKNYKNEILTRLIDKYERSRSFTGDNTVKQSFTVDFAKEFPEYSDDARIQEIQAINQAADELDQKGLVTIRKAKNGLRKAAVLNADALNEGYIFLGRKPRKELNKRLEELLEQYCGSSELLDRFCSKQLERLQMNKNIEYFDGDFRKFENVLKAAAEATRVNSETYRRDFSIRVFGDSKQFEKILGTVESILFNYGDFPEKDTVLEELNIVRNPGHVYFKGQGILTIAGQTMDLSKLKGDIAVSSVSLGQIENIRVTGQRVITIENLTTFNAFDPGDAFVIYLGGYHNAPRRLFIQKLFQSNKEKEYYHYGDIDAGGFQILEHLRSRTGVLFQPLHMDIETLRANLSYTKKLTENDRKRLKAMLEKESGGELDEVIRYMLDHDCKLEQEALDQSALP